MRVLIFGGKGMLGHKLVQTMGEPIDAWTTVRGAASDLQKYSFYCPDRVIGGIDATKGDSIRKAFDLVKPNAVVNCIGIVKQHPLAKGPDACNAINAKFPHFLSAVCREHGTRLVHISTDCVYTGNKGGYLETDLPDAADLYGCSKAQGEVRSSNAITLRTSIVGRELGNGLGLVEWFLAAAKSPTAKVKGYTQAFFSGLTTVELSRVIQKVLLKHADLNGIYQVSSERIDKHSLLEHLREAFRLDVEIEPDDELRIDRSLDSTRFRQATNYLPPSWPEMVRELALDPTPYDSWRSH